MRRQVWSVEEIRDVLLAANEASGMAIAATEEGSEERGQVWRAYRQGFKAALVTVALALGISPMVATVPPDMEDCESRGLITRLDQNMEYRRRVQ